MGEGGVDAIGAARQGWVGEHRGAAIGLYGGDDLRIAGGHRDGANAGFTRAIEHVEDHRAAMDIGQRLARQAGGGQARRDEDDRVHGIRTIGAGVMPQDGPVRQGAAVCGCGFLGVRPGGGLMQTGLLPMVRRIFW